MIQIQISLVKSKKGCLDHIKTQHFACEIAQNSCHSRIRNTDEKYQLMDEESTGGMVITHNSGKMKMHEKSSEL
jgi:hypothetical protein